MKAKEFRELSREELTEKAKELGQEIFNLRFQKATGQLGNTASIPKAKRDLARVKTVLSEVKISSASN